MADAAIAIAVDVRAGRRTAPELTARGWAAELAWGGVRAIARCRPGRLDLHGAPASAASIST